jgi:hypothetical protein
MNVERDRDGWKITSEVMLTDEQAKAVTFMADPIQVTLGGFVKIVDPGGIRIGHVEQAYYRERHTGPSYVICSIRLR